MQIKPELQGHQQDLHEGRNQSTDEEVGELAFYKDDLKPHAAARWTGSVDVYRPHDQTDQPADQQFVH